MSDSTEPVNFGKMWAAAQTAGDMKTFMKMKILVEGGSGSGKTSFASRFARPLVACTELQAIPIVKIENPNALIFHNSEGREGIRDARDLQQFRAMVRDPKLHEHVDAVVLDGITDAQVIIKESYGRAQDNSSVDEIAIKTWNAIGGMTIRLIRELRDLPVHVVVTVLDAEVEDDGRIVHRPDLLMKKLPNKMMQFFNVVAFLHTQKKSGGIRFQTMLRSDSNKYRVKAMRGLDNVEPPEPLYWAHKIFGEDLPDDVKERVETWRAMDVEADDDDDFLSGKKKTKEKTKKTKKVSTFDD